MLCCFIIHVLVIIYILLLGDSICWTSISDIIEDVMDVGFDVMLNDFSADHLSQHICQLYCDWNKSTDTRKNVIDELKNLPVPIPIQVVSVRPIREKPQVIIDTLFGCTLY